MISVNYSSQCLQPCDHEEADTRIALHLYDAVNQGATNILVHTVDTDIIAILVGLFFNIHSPINIWVAFGTGKNFRYYSINSICQALGEEKSRALPFFHAFTGCDTTSQFHGKAKRSAWEAWKSYPPATMAFVRIFHEPFQPLTLQSGLFEILERFTCVLYDKTTALSSVNDLRQELFSRHSKLMENIPPTQVRLVFSSNTQFTSNFYDFYRQLYFSIVIGHSISAVFGVKAFRACKMHHHLIIMAGRKMKMCGNQYGHIYQRQLKPAGNY